MTVRRPKPPKAKKAAKVRAVHAKTPHKAVKKATKAIHAKVRTHERGKIVKH